MDQPGEICKKEAMADEVVCMVVGRSHLIFAVPGLCTASAFEMSCRSAKS